MVKKHDGCWRMCVDFRDLTKHVRRIVTPFQKSIGRSNPSAPTPLSLPWMPTKAIIKYRWPNKMRKRRLSTPVMGQKIFSTLQNLEEVHQKEWLPLHARCGTGFQTPKATLSETTHAGSAIRFLRSD
nr:hypothetical protein [Tanacetum cinerariifolium]